MKYLMMSAGLLAMAVLASDDAAASGGKSIVDPKYRKKDGEKDFVAKLIDDNATKYKEVVKKTKVEGTDPVEYVESKEKRADGVDVDGLFTLARVNNLDVAKFEAQRENHGFPGRFRMTVSNMLRAAAKARHGLFAPNPEGGDPIWHDAPKDFLAAKGASDEPTHNRDGSKIVKAKPAADAESTAPETADA